MRIPFRLAALLGALILSGCARHKLAPPPATAPAGRDALAGATDASPSAGRLIVSQENGLCGKVASANQNLRFVVVTFPITRMPALEQRLVVYRGGLKVGEVKISGPQQEDNIVADIVAGEAEPGDEVRDQ
jgi:hypothetical protein